MAPKIFPKFKRTTLPPSDLLDVHVPDLYYSVQQAFQNENVLLIDLGNHGVIEGQVNASEVGLSNNSKPLKVKRRLGFIQNTTPEAIEYEKRDLDAILILDPESQTPGGAFYLLVEVIEDHDLEEWLEIILKVARQFVIRVEGKLQPEVIFGVTSLSRGNGKDVSARDAVLRKYQELSQDQESAISFITLHPEDTFEDEEDDGDEEENEI